MANIIDYVRENSDTFAERAINRVDSLIFSWLAYVRYPEDSPVRTKEGQTLYETFGFGSLLGMVAPLHDPRETEELLKAIAASPRFKDVVACLHYEKSSKVEEQQFSAICFRLPDDKGTYVAYRGTDNTLIGWKEDFNMAFAAAVPAQITAGGYLLLAAEQFKGDLWVGGHSKGGNLAVYAVLKADDLVRLRVEKCFSHDGPGLNEACMSDPAWPTTAALVDKTIPEESIIGLIFEGREITPVIVRSTNPGLLQHAPFSWEVEGIDFDIQRAVSYDSYKTGKRLNAWLKTMDEAGRERFVTILYKLAESTGEVTFSGLTDSVKNGSLSLMLQKLDNMSAEDKKFFTDALSDLVATILLGPAPKKAVTPTEKVAEAGDKIDDATARFNDRLAQIERLAGL